ncbi:MAG: MBL fold metallo-hydrolase [Nitrospirae bacterium]|nr:MBL fold metallo-hydrolase [Nitrospirota bacterium]
MLHIKNISQGGTAIDFRICTLASGSKGNCVYIEGGGTRILVDAGLTMRETKLRLSLIDVRAEDIDAVIITHEHTDHIKGVGPLCRAHGIPVYITGQTYTAARDWIGKKVVVCEFETGTGFDIKGIRIEPFDIPHDAVNPVGFTFYSGTMKAGLATDLGYATTLVIERLKGCNALVLESNHDPVMLKDGPYPWHLKQRVSGKQGHLSNSDAGRLLEQLLHDGLSHVVLAHISQVNNMPELAHSASHETLRKNSCGHIKLYVAGQDAVCGMVEV